MECLQELRLDGTDIKELPVSIELMSGLVSLNLKDCRNLASLPITIGSLECLQTLVLSGCSKIVKFPETVISVVDMSELFLDGTSITEECKMLQNLPRLPASIHWISLDGCVSLETISDVLNLNLNEHQPPYLSLHCVDCLKLAGNYDLALSLLKEYIKNSENMSLSDKYIKKDPMRGFCIVVPGSEIPEWFEYQNNEGSSITISTPPKTYKNSKLVGYAMCCVFHVPKYSLPYYIRSVPYPVHELSINSKPTTDGLSSIFFRKQFGQAMSDHLFLYYQNRERISKVEFDSPSGLELKRAEASGSCCGDDAGSTTSSERRFLKRSLEGYVGAAEASGSGCCNDEEEPQPKRFRQLE
ncbi:hypothetical protein CUMW_258010 [Citrus unshiu]|uniref:C-JID domain-containing protein n=1 Tax=Citrus unshiu TaxID=55188 RepID=A0A2H5QSP6_CITUN|nr:hypothetical protein CUMW_258010 [Citrus unshiu]